MIRRELFDTASTRPWPIEEGVHIEGDMLSTSKPVYKLEEKMQGMDVQVTKRSYGNNAHNKTPGNNRNLFFTSAVMRALCARRVSAWIFMWGAPRNLQFDRKWLWIENLSPLRSLWLFGCIHVCVPVFVCIYVHKTSMKSTLTNVDIQAFFPIRLICVHGLPGVNLLFTTHATQKSSFYYTVN